MCMGFVIAGDAPGFRFRSVVRGDARGVDDGEFVSGFGVVRFRERTEPNALAGPRGARRSSWRHHGWVVLA